MDIQQAINLLSGENHKFFKEQVSYFEIDITTPLKEYLDIIDNDVLEWFKSAPKQYTKESTFFKFKSPLHTLLQHKDVVEQYGHTYCNTLSNKITNVFSKHKKDIVKNDKKINIDKNNEDQTSTYASSDTSTEHEDKTPLNIDDIVYDDPNQKQATNIDYTKKIHDLEAKLQESTTEIKMLETSVYHYKELIEVLRNDKEHLMKLLCQFAPK